jgi:uncharacterized caspase-like protein
MPGSSLALIVASDRYEDPALRKLRGPAKEAEALAATLADPAIGGFQVRTLINQPAHLVTEEIEAFFDARARDDLLLLYFSCHGIKDDGGRLYFASTSTKLNRLAATGISSVFVNERMDESRSRKIVLLLDCCYSGAFARGMVPRATATVDIQERFEGRGRAIITASTAMEYAFETDGDVVSGSGTPSLFSKAVLDGLRTGDADLDGDGLVSVDELYDYVFRIVRETTPDQTPSMIGNVQGELYLARSPRNRAADAGVALEPTASAQPMPSRPLATGAPVPPAESAPAATPDAADRPESPGGVPGLWPLLRERRALTASVVVAAVVLVLVAFLLSNRSTGAAPTSATGPSPSSSGAPSTPSPSSSAGPVVTGGVLSQGKVRLADPTTGLDLATGQTVGVFQSQLAWNGPARLLSVFDETTLGAVVLGGVDFAGVTPAQLASASYRRGADNPPLSPADLPPGRVLAVHVADQDYAKVTVVQYGSNDDLTLHWVSYRTG